MNEKELERRFRSVTEERQPNAPRSLRHFLHELPETRPAHGNPGLRRLWRSLARPAQVPRLAFGGAAVAFALVVGLVGSNLLLGIRGNNNVAATPTFAADGFLWTGNLDARAMVPRAAVAGGPEGYLGVGPSADGTGVLLTSKDALHWSEKQTSAIDPKTVDLRWIARGEVGFVAVGATLLPTSGPLAAPPIPDPRFFYSADGSNWQESAVDDSVKGAPALTVVVGPNGFLAAGWNGSNAAEAGMAGTYLWGSTDGRTWNGGWTQAAVDGEGFLMGSPDTYLMSGDPVPVGYQPQGALPIFTSAEGFQAWTQTSGEAGLAQIGPAIGGVATDSDKKLLLLVWETKADATAVDGKTELIGGDAGVFSAVPTAAGSPADLRSLVLVGGKTLLATAASGSVYVSSDWGVDWQRVEFGASRPTPTGKSLIDLGNGKCLLLGKGGIWVATPL
jgi:hypothetical protein